MPKNTDDEDPPTDPYENMSEDDRAYFEAMEEKHQREDDHLDDLKRTEETERERRYDEDDPLAD